MIRSRVGLLSSLAITVCASFVWLASLGGRLEYRVDEIVRGDWWRVATCHLAHVSFEQLLWDGVALVVSGFVYDRVAGGEHWRLAVAIAGSALVIPVAIASFEPRLETYRGLSGIDSAMFVLVGCLALRGSVKRGERFVIAVALAGFVAKVTAEVVTGGALFVQDLGPGVVAVPVAHAAGALTGLLAALPRGWSDRVRLEAPVVNGGR